MDALLGATGPGRVPAALVTFEPGACTAWHHPLLAEGQLHGSLAQGLGQVLMEEIVYDGDGQLLTGTLMDHAIPRADEVPLVDIVKTCTPSPLNSLGAKGVGEAGCIGIPPAVVNAAVDALSPFSVTEVEMPLTPARLWEALRTRAQAPA